LYPNIGLRKQQCSSFSSLKKGMNPSLKQSSTSSGMHEQSEGCQEIPPIFWLFLPNKLKHTVVIPEPTSSFLSSKQDIA
jgi:hypothetical protein